MNRSGCGHRRAAASRGAAHRGESEDPDDEDELIPNPAYQWTPPMIPNPEYRPPRSLLTKVRGEVGEAVPWVTLGVLITATLDAIQLPLGKLQARLGHGSLLGAAIIGLLTPLCSCGSLPVARGFADAGVPLGTVVAFLTATQCSGIDSLAVTWGLLGRTAARSEHSWSGGACCRWWTEQKHAHAARPLRLH